MSSIFLERIQNTDRDVVESTFFDDPTRLVLLSYIGAADYFITEFGLIWDRKKTFVDHRGKLTKYYQPWVFLDPYFKYPWVLLRTTIGDQWFPVNQLLGWSYRLKTMEKKYFLLKEYKPFPHKIDDFEWTDRPPENPRSFYLKWMKSVGM